jgi:transposase
MPILVAIEAVDGRKGIDSLAQLCQEKLQADPFSGCLFVFRSRRGTSIRILVYDGQGFWLAQKRLRTKFHLSSERMRFIRSRRS